mgnify:CR=1 FL=1
MLETSLHSIFDPALQGAEKTQTPHGAFETPHGAFETPHGAFGIVASIDGFYGTLRVPDHSLDQHSGGGHRRTTYEMPNASQLDGGLGTLPIMISLDGTVVSFRSEQTFNWPPRSKQIAMGIH